MNKGYVAITSVLLIAAAAVVIGMGITLSSISEGQTALTSQFGYSALDLTEGCVEQSLYLINISNTLPSSITIPSGTCSVSLASHVGAVWTYTVTGTANGHTKTITITVTRSNTMTPISWKEL